MRVFRKAPIATETSQHCSTGKRAQDSTFGSQLPRREQVIGVRLAPILRLCIGKDKLHKGLCLSRCSLCYRFHYTDGATALTTWTDDNHSPPFGLSIALFPTSCCSNTRSLTSAGVPDWESRALISASKKTLSEQCGPGSSVSLGLKMTYSAVRFLFQLSDLQEAYCMLVLMSGL